MIEAKKISKAEMVLLAAYKKWPDSEFTAEELVVACWQEYPGSFGLQGYSTEYPDANIVYRHIMGKNSIVKKQRWLSQKSQKRYKVSPSGISHALKLSGIDDLNSQNQLPRIDRFHEQILFKALTKSAWVKYKNNQIDTIIFPDVCSFWSINPRSSREQLNSARHDLDEAILMAEKQLDKGNGELLLAAKVHVSRKDLNDLKILKGTLAIRFKDQLDAISHRSIKWGKMTEA